MIRTVPRSYARFVESAIASAIRDARRDAERRANGEPCWLPDPLVDRELSGDAIVMVGDVPDDEEQLVREEWPTVPAKDVKRFPQARSSTVPQRRHA